MTAAITRTIKDDKGVEHQYHLVQFGALQGIRLGSQFMELVAGSLQLEGGVSSIIRGGVRALATVGNEAYLLEMVSLCSRDGERLDQRHVFEAAYQANYGELLRALEFVAEENFAGFSSAVGDVIGRRLVSMLAPQPGSNESWLAALLTGFSGPLSEPSSAHGSKSPDTGP